MAEAAARALAPLSETAGRAARDGLPDAVPFLTATGLEPPGAAGIRSRWAAGGRTTHALLGARSGGPFILDLAQGPHLLVAGTSGSGKSELLQTLVASLAVANRPDAMNFVLIDYKGGAAFRGFSQLPHAVGMLTDLDEFLVERALTSLHAELQRRKSVLDAADKSDIRRYWDALPEMPGWDPLPRLVIVVDEFAVMAEQLPDQLQSLMVIGRQGRSLGIHLVLATQRPAGIVNNDLRSNINQRIALRVSSPEDSRDIIEAPDAARIPKEFSGRAYAWLGSGNPVAFQTAYVGATRPSEPAALTPALARPLRWPDLGRPAADPTAPDRSDGAATDLSALVTAIASAASAERQDRQRSPWLPPLPPVITLGQLPAATPAGLRLPFGLIDKPQSQQQIPAVLDISRGGHLLAAGAPQSGRSTLLRTLAAALADVSADETQLYVLDGGRALSALAALPHCGAVVTSDEPDRVDRLLGRLTSELSARIRLLSAEGHSNLAEYQETQVPADRPPFLLVFVDQYDALVTALEHIAGFLVIGPSGSGRSTALAIQATSLAAVRVPLVLVTPRRSPLAGVVDRAAVRSHVSGTDAEAATALGAVLGQPGTVGVVVDDAELLTGTPVGDELTAWYRRIRDSDSRLMAAVSADSVTVPRGLILELSRGRCGLILDPSSPADGSPLGLRLPAAVLASGLKLRGALIADGQVTAIQVPELP